MHPQPRMQNKKAYEHSHHGHTGVTRHSPRNGFNGFLRDLVSAKSGRMCERAALTNRPSLDLSPFVLKGCEPDGELGTDPVSSSTRTVAWALSPNRARKGVGAGSAAQRPTSTAPGPGRGRRCRDAAQRPICSLDFQPRKNHVAG